jgi:hypothetical protein
MPCSEPSNSERCVAHVAGSVVSSTAKPWFCDVISTRPDAELEHRVVGAVVPELHLDGARAAREPEQLVAEADAEHRDVGLEDLLDRRDRIVAGLGITGTVRQEHAVGRSASTSSAGVCAGTTVMRQPWSASSRRMLRLMPKS